MSGRAVLSAAMAATTIETAVHTTNISQTLRNPNFSSGDAPTVDFIRTR
jgi:hypothetical protein